MTVENKPASVLDRHIRAALTDYLMATDPSVALFHELPLARGKRRADLVAVNGHISGFEIKSERDSLRRLSAQAIRYDSVCEFSSVVISRKHLKAVREQIPSKWGIMVAYASGATVDFQEVRMPKLNHALDRQSLIKLLWKNECIRILRLEGHNVSMNIPVIDLWGGLATVPSRKLIGYVRLALKERLS